MKNFFKRLTAMLLVAIMVAPQFQLPSFAWDDQYKEWFKIESNLNYWRADSTSTYTENGTTYISTKGPVKQSAFNSTVTFDENAGYTTFGHYVHAAHDAVGSNTHAVMNGLWVPYTSSRNVTHINPPIADSDGDGDREINLKGLNGSIYTYDTLTGPYNFSFKMKVDKAPARPQDALWAFFRGDEGDFETTEGHRTVYDQINDDGGLGGSGLAFYVSGTNEITLVIKTAKENTESQITSETIRFVTQTTLTDGQPHTYTVIDTGIDANHNGEGNYIYLMVDNEPVCYIRATGFEKYSTKDLTRKSYVTTDVNKDDSGNDIQIYNASKVNYHFDSLQNDNSYYFHNLLVYSPTGIIVHESFNALCRNYSRLALGGCSVTANTYIDDIAVTTYNRDAFEVAAAAQIDTSKGIYLPITIRDFAADSILFEWMNNEMDNGSWEEHVEHEPPVAVVSTHSSNLIGHRWNIHDTNSRTFFSHYFNFFPGEVKTNNGTTQYWGTPNTVKYTYRDYDVIYNTTTVPETASSNPDGSLTVTSTSNDPWIGMQYNTGNTFDLKTSGWEYLVYAFKPTSGTFADGETADIYLFNTKASVDTDLYNKIRIVLDEDKVGANSDITIYRQESTFSSKSGTMVKCTEEGYEDYYIVYIPCTELRINMNSTISFRIDYTNTSGRSYDILYFALLGKQASVTNGNPSVDTTMTGSTATGDLYPYYRISHVGGTGSASDGQINLTGIINDTQNYKPLDSVIYGITDPTDETTKVAIQGFVYLRYRTPQTGGATEFSIFSIYDGGTNLIAKRNYIADGKWHDLIIPVQASDAASQSLRFDAINKNSGTSSGNVYVDISSIRYINAHDFAYATGYITASTSTNVSGTKSASFATAAGKGHLSEKNSIDIWSGDGTLENPISNFAYFSPESYTANGKLSLYEYHITDTYGSTSTFADVAISGSTSKYLQLRYRTNVTTPVTLTFTLSDGTVKTYEYYLKADETWNTRVLELKLGDDAEVKEIEATYTSADGLWLEIGDLNFYETRNAAWYYSDDPTYDFEKQGSSEPQYGGFGFEAGSRVWRDANGDGIYDKQTNLFFYPHQNENSGDDIKNTNGSGFDQSIEGTFISAAEGDNGEVMSHAGAYQGMLEKELRNGKPRYTYRAVSYIAKHLEMILPIELDDEYGYKKYGSLLGEESMYIAEKVGVDYPIEMREALLMCIEGELDPTWRVVASTKETYNGATAYNYAWNTTEEEYEKYDGYLTFEALMANKANNDCFDLAYFLLHNLFTDEYGTEVYEYNALKLIQGYDEEGVNEEPSYTFDTNRDDTRYEPTGTKDGFTGLIYNTQAATAAGTFQVDKMFSDNKYDFDPLGTQRDMQLGEGLEGAEALGFGNSTYGTVSAMNRNKNERFYRDFHYTMQGSANFVYNVDRDQYFDFIGDDDVYLFINDTLVLDVGGAHFPSRGVIYLNDLVEKGTLDLVDGNEYTFEFFYMERHFGDANISINTNIELSVPEIDVVKDGYQKDSKGTLNKLQYGDNIIASNPVIYEFSLTNTTSEQFDHKLTDIKFVDNDLGVTISQDVVDWGNKGAELADGAFVELTDANGNSLSKILCSTDVEIKDAFKNIELERDQTLTIYGISYELPDKTNTFHNTVTGIATYYKAYNDDGTPIDESVATLTDTDDFLVNVSEMHVYVQKDVERQFIFREIFDNSTRIGGSTYGELKNQAYFKNSAYIQLCDGYKKPITNIDEIHFTNNSLQLSTFETNTSNNAYLTTDATGLSTFMFTVNYNEPQPDNTEIARSYGPYYVAVYSYAFEDKNYVLDYGLPVVIEDELNASTDDDYNKVDPYIDQIKASEASAQALDSGYDVFVIADNPEETGKEFLAYSNYSTLKYGSLNIDDATQATKPKENLTYTPNKFIEGRDSFNVTVGVYEKEIDDDNLFKDNVYHITNGVQMTKTVSFVPASVMYYEESIGSITLANGMAHGAVDGADKNTQSPNQSWQYGYDETAYAKDPDAQTGTANATFAWYGQAAISCGPVISTNNSTGMYTYNFSNGTYAHLNTQGSGYSMTKECVTFTFTGTGFDVISTTDLAAAMIDVRIYAHGTTTNPIYRLPVNCTYTNGTLSQVPVFSKKDLAWGTYDVKIYASKPYNTYLSTDFYLDGIRIYDPASRNEGDDIVNTYLADEKLATIVDLRDMILNVNKDQKFGVAQLTINANNQEVVTFGANNSVVEHIHDAGSAWGSSNDNVQVDASHIDDAEHFTQYTYEAVGPKNECYLANGTAFFGRIFIDNANINTLQIEARLIEPNVDSAEFKYVVFDRNTNEAVSEGTISVDSYTSMYYDIDISKCNLKVSDDGHGGYGIVIGPSGNSSICFTNVKYKGMYWSTVPRTGTNYPSDDNGNYTNTYDFATYTKYLKQVSGYSNTSTTVVVNKVSVSTNTAEGTVVLKVQTNAAATKVAILDSNGNTVVSSDSANTFGNVKIFTVTMPAGETGTGYKAVAYDKDNRASAQVTVNFNGTGGSVTESPVPDGTLLYFQNFESDEYTGTNGELLTSLNWTTTQTSAYSIEYSLSESGASGNNALYINQHNNGTMISDAKEGRSIVEILTADQMAPYYGDGKVVTLQYDLQYISAVSYTKNAGGTSNGLDNFISLLPAYDKEDDEYLYGVVRHNGQGANLANPYKKLDGLEDTYASKVLYGSSVAMTGKSFSVRYVLDWVENKNYIYVRANDGTEHGNYTQPLLSPNLTLRKCLAVLLHC